MKKYLLIGVAALTLFAVVGGAKYNQLVPLEEKVNFSYSEVQSQLKRQADLIPNLAEVAKGYMNSEQKTMIEVAAARAGEAAKIKPADVANNPKLQEKLIEAQKSTASVLVTMNSVREQYPQLKADGQINRLMTSLEGTQNRVTVARHNNQKTVNEYNLEVRQFPGNVVALLVGFKKLPYFEAGEDAQNAPKLNFK
mgnify:FL=1